MSNFFSGIHFFERIIQGIGFCGILCSVISFQCKKHGKILFFRTMNELLFGIQYLLLGAYTGAAMNFIGCVRNILFSRQVEKEKSTILSRLIFSLLFLVFAIATWSGVKSILIGIAKVGSTVAYGCRNTIVMRLIILLTSTLWLMYNIGVGSWAGAICESFTILSIFVALFRIGRMKRRESVSQ